MQLKNLPIIAVLLFILSSCAAPQPDRALPPTPTSSSRPLTSTITLPLTGAIDHTYTISATPRTPTSKLRHGHKEFTFYLTDGSASLILAFYGYEGPRTYTLSAVINGGDVRIALDKEARAWDLSTHDSASCTLTIATDKPTSQPSISIMTGSLTCPILLPANPTHPDKSITLTNAQFTIAILIES